MSKISIIDEMGGSTGTHPAVIQNIRNLAQGVRALAAGAAAAASSSVSQAEIAAINNALAELDAEVQEILNAEVQTYTAVTAISQYTPVFATGNNTAGIATASTPTTLQSLVGIASGNAAAGSVIPLVRAGQTIQNTAWSWTPGAPVYVGTGAALTQTIPAVAQPWQIGVALTSTILYVEPMPVLPSSSALVECAYATAAALPGNTYSNGTLGLGATLTATANGALSVDGAAVAVGQRILVQNEATTANNGIYIVTAAGGVSAVYVLTRTTDFCLASQIGPGFLVPIKAASGLTAGTANDGKAFLSSAPSPFTVGTSAISFTAVSGATYSADGTTITLTGTQFGLTTIANNDVLANISGSTAKPVATGLSALLDAVLGNTQGGTLYRGSSAWALLAPGTAGQLLQTNGSSANPTWVTGGGVSSGLTQIGKVVCSGSQATVTFSNIPAGFNDLMVSVSVQATGAVGPVNVSMMMNGDSTAGHYIQSQEMYANGSSVNGYVNAASSLGLIVFAAAGTSLTSTPSTVSRVFIPAYASTVLYKGFTVENGVNYSSTANSNQVEDFAGVWNSTAAITSLTFTIPSGSFLDGSVFTLYGIGGASSVSAKAYNSATQSISANTGTALTFDTNKWDTGSIHSTSSNTSRFTCPAGYAGRWRFTYCTYFNSSVGANAYIWAEKNGAQIIGSAASPPAAVTTGGTNGSVIGTCEEILAVGDYVEAWVFSSVATNVGATSSPPNQQSSMTAEFINAN